MNLYTYTIHRCTTYTPSTAICTIHFEIYTKHQYALYNCMQMCTFTSLWPLHWSPTGAIPSVHWSPIQTHHKLLYVPHISNTQLNPFFSHSSIHRRHAYTRLQTAGGSKHIAAQSTSIQCNVQLCSTFNRNVCINSFVYFCISLALQPATGELPLWSCMCREVRNLITVPHCALVRWDLLFHR